VNAKLDALKERSFRVYELNGAPPEQTYFVDGGVLDNKPFGWAIDTIVNARPAESEVDRRLLYLEPDPGEVAAQAAHEDPDTLHAALGALTKIPSSEPILDDLLDVVAHNERVQHIRDIVEESFARVDVLVRKATGVDDLASIATMPPAQWPWSDWSRAVNDCARTEAGIAYATYVRLKVGGVVDRFARTIWAICNYPGESNHALLVRAAVRAWAEQQLLFAKSASEDPCPQGAGEAPAAPDVPTEAQSAFLRAFDLGYTVRRLRFVIAALNWWYRCVGQDGFPSRDDLDQGKKIVYDSIGTLVGLADGSAFEDGLRERVRQCFPEAGLRDFLTAHGLDGVAYAEQRGAELDDLAGAVREYVQASLKGSGPALLERLAELSRQWDERRRRDLLVRYLGFPVWDVLLYPVQVLSPVGERDAIEVVRMSPHEATVLGTPPAQKVQGRQLNHFYAFFHRSARENDYLWGRLDGAEHLVRLVLESAGSSQPVERWCKEAFAAVLEEEKDALPTARATLDRLRTRVEAL
jgi:patatin-related protein